MSPHNIGVCAIDMETTAVPEVPRCLYSESALTRSKPVFSGAPGLCRFRWADAQDPQSWA
ncbi:hypothetical protein EVJ58_g3962 [Rhodofomes roseus]|uniref:Uncharacterized protein n=1 Tax=Rhodofomes roseus TaxID=34475 RepID=A0A4Y9YKY2_9APHY|nr:hypothetical protein EVJ58_g3962 [Rhodofomes roseus]